jgi:hypothetical protein
MDDEPHDGAEIWRTCSNHYNHYNHVTSLWQRESGSKLHQASSGDGEACTSCLVPLLFLFSLLVCAWGVRSSLGALDLYLSSSDLCGLRACATRQTQVGLLLWRNPGAFFI